MNSDAWGRVCSICQMHFQNGDYTDNQSYILVMFHTSMSLLQLLYDIIVAWADFKGHDESLLFSFMFWFESFAKDKGKPQASNNCKKKYLIITKKKMIGVKESKCNGETEGSNG